MIGFLALKLSNNFSEWSLVEEELFNVKNEDGSML